MRTLNETPTFPGYALDWAIEAAVREAVRVRALLGLPEVVGDLEGYAKRLEDHAETLRIIKENVVQA